MNNEKENWVLIQRYVLGIALPEERDKLELWMDKDPENKKCLQDVEEIMAVSLDDEFEVSANKSWEDINLHLSDNNTRTKSVRVNFRKPIGIQRYIYQIASIILVSLFTGILVQHYTAEKFEAMKDNGTPVMQELVTKQGEKARVTFSDGTEVTLNSASSLRFPEVFQNSKREVYLEGEAYFKVQNDSGKPFAVYSQEVEVEVLGTEFNVRGWNTEPSVDITVREGIVSVNSLDPNVEGHPKRILTEGLYTRVAKGKIPDPAKKVDVRNNLLWISGGVHFNKVPFDRVLNEIERRFNVGITNASKLSDEPYTGTFQYAELDEILSVIAASMQVEYRREGSEIKFN